MKAAATDFLQWLKRNGWKKSDITRSRIMKFAGNPSSADNIEDELEKMGIKSSFWEQKQTTKKEKSPMQKKLREAIRSLVYEVLAEASREQVSDMIGREAAIKYRKKSGEVKTYFGRFAKISGENVYFGAMGKGMRSFIINNILDIRPVEKEQLSTEQITALDEMTAEFLKPHQKKGAKALVKSLKKQGIKESASKKKVS